MINYAHRGASEYAPENTLAAFYLGLSMGANGLETDVQATKDGTLVLFHDDSLSRILPGVSGGIPDYTYGELLGFDFGAYKGPAYAGERLVRLEDFLRYFGGRPLALAIEIKQTGTEEAVVDMMRAFGVLDRAVVTSFSLDSLLRVRKLMPEQRTGYLTGLEAEILDELVAEGIWQYCPKAERVTKDLVAEAKAKGLNVRAWGVKTRESMRNCCVCNVDGMTVNFPDALSAYLREGERA